MTQPSIHVRRHFNTKQEMLDWLGRDVIGRVVVDDDGDKWISVGKGHWVCPDADDLVMGDKLTVHTCEGLMCFTMDCRVLVLNEGYEANVRG